MSVPRPLTAPHGGDPAICPHCWMVNPGPFRLCSRCGASMETYLQESGGLRSTAPIQSPVPVNASGRLTPVQRMVVGAFLALMALGHLVHLLPSPRSAAASPHPAPASR